MLYRKTIAVCSEIHTKHINAICGQNVEFFNDPRGTHSNHWALKGWQWCLTRYFGVEMTFYTSISEEFASNICRDSDYPKVFCGLP